jgi:sugar lactone lactonase YvrE
VDVEQLTGPIAHHGEGPVWSPSWGGLRWVDMTAGDILSFDTHGDVQRRHVGSPVAAAVRPRRGGGAVIGVERGFALEEPDGRIHTLPELWSDSAVRMDAILTDGSIAARWPTTRLRAPRRFTGWIPTVR